MIKKILCLILCAALLTGCRNSGNKVSETKQKNEKSETLEAQKEILETYQFSQKLERKEETILEILS